MTVWGQPKFRWLILLINHFFFLIKTLNGFEPLPWTSLTDCRPAPPKIEPLKSSIDWVSRGVLIPLKLLKPRVSSLICKKGFMSITEYFKHIWPRNLADLVNFGSQTRKNFYQHEKLRLNAVRMRIISSKDFEKRDAVARELWSWNSAYSVSFWPCHQIQLERMSIFILFWDMTL